jgi:4-amino-4-deoxy-L-arabinose transferase-like glycosyltransferase
VTPHRRALYGLTLAALLVRLAVWPWFAGVEPRIYDEGDYVDIAVNLAERGEFRMDGRVTTARPPLYPAMVSVIYRVAGVRNHQAVRLIQIVLNLALVPLVFALGRRLYDARTGVAAAALAVFYPSLWGHDYLLLTEVLFTVLLVAGTLALVEYTSRPRWPLLIAAGLAFGLGTLTRTSLLFYPALFAIVLFAWWRAESRRRIAAVAIFVAVFALTLAPWIARNTRVQGHLSSVDSFSMLTAARYSPLRHLASRSAGDRARQRAAAPEGSSDGAAKSGRPRGEPAASPTPAQADGEIGDVQIDASGGRIRRMLKGVMWDTLLFWRIDRELAGAAARGWLGPLPRPVVLVLTAVIAAYYVALMLAGSAGLVLRPPADRLALAIVLAAIAVLVGVHALSIGHSRYHIPIMPLVSVFAARLWAAGCEPVPRRRLAAAIAVGALLIASWTATFVRFDLRDVRHRLTSPPAEAGDRQTAPRLH